MGVITIEYYDCSCVLTRRKESRYYAARWKIKKSTHWIILRCLDCGRTHHFRLLRPDIQVTTYEPAERNVDFKEDENGSVDTVLGEGKFANLPPRCKEGNDILPYPKG